MTPPAPSGRATASELVGGWGRASPSAATVVRISSQAELDEQVSKAARTGAPVLARGLGRSYGDAAQCAGGTILDCTALDRIDTGELTDGVVRVEAGVSIDALLRRVVPLGWCIPVTPGTAHVSVGGAIAADVHGKNHHRNGTLARYTNRVSLVTPKGRLELSAADNELLYWATVGGMGLTGVIAQAELTLEKIETSSMVVETTCTTDIDDCMTRLVDGDATHDYSVAWVDCLARGRRLGRSVVSFGRRARLGDLPAGTGAPALDYRPRARSGIGFDIPVNAVRREAILACNELWYQKARFHASQEVQPMMAYFYPLDGLPGWNRLYGPQGFAQYQFVVPVGAEATIRAVIEHLQREQVPVSLAVLKRFGEADAAPMSFPAPGWTLALDIPLAVQHVAPALDGIDELVASAHGRVYLAKDGRLRPELLHVMYPRLAEWVETLAGVDPCGVFVSDLWRRLRPVALENRAGC